MGDLGGLTLQLTSSSFGRDVKIGVPCLDAACTVGLNQLSIARNPDKPTQNKLKTKNKQTNFRAPTLNYNYTYDYKSMQFNRQPDPVLNTMSTVHN